MTDLFIPAQNAMVTKIAFSAKKSDGFNPSLCICDEVMIMMKEVMAVTCLLLRDLESFIIIMIMMNFIPVV